MKNLSTLCTLAAVSMLASCGMFGKNSNKGGLPNDGQLHGVAPGNKYSMPKPPGMVYIPPGTFHMGPSDEDVNYAYTARNKQVSINGFWMDATEITNNEYRQFVNWVRDSTAAKLMGFVKNVDGVDQVDWAKAKTIKWGDKATIEKIDQLILSPENRIFGKKELDASKLVYHSETFDNKDAAKRENAGKPRSQFIVKKDVRIYPDTLVWIRDFSYSYNEPMTKRYFSHPAFGNYPVVGVSWVQATAFCEWRTHYLNSFLESKKRAQESDFRLPTEAEWEYAARGGRSQSMFPWGNYYLRNKKGCLLANFKPGRGNYPEDGGFYTVRADAYWPNDFGLYNMAGNVAEWTSSLYYEGGYNFQHDMNPDIRYNAKDSDPPRMKRKVLRGGSWKDVGYFLQTGTRSYEYQDTAKSYIGFRSVIDLPPTQGKGKK
ncbi:T9SS ring complex lipoprotein PorK/GldK [Flavihumibacter cheonanensis]|uniref:type IX secretion system lipoprotein PorK/GldK n=1 Tax=Flavihumibacter cheonanensis TaxID=1442385 RepID=UPI001EF8C5F0|nr:SUMF1/EgtB/PvdO family nonheme iron enzyme [Flavihumibacter cheonanensis]MCG7753784.1 SUMF1/EgtB/PvdO family nonheme iron enzyme [Flavihumibacter cheonanensis]